MKGKKERKWLTDGERIFFGPGQCYKIRQLHIFSLIMQAAGILTVVLTGAGVLVSDELAAYMGSLIGFGIFLYGMHLNGIVRRAKEEGITGEEEKGKPGIDSEKDQKDWFSENAQIRVGEKRTYSVMRLTVYSFLIRFLSLAALILSGIRILGGSQYIAIISFALAGVVFLYGRQMGKLARNAKRDAIRRAEAKMSAAAGR